MTHAVVSPPHWPERFMSVLLSSYWGLHASMTLLDLWRAVCKRLDSKP